MPVALPAKPATLACPSGVHVAAYVLLLLTIDDSECCSAMEDGKRRKKNMICGARTSVIEERGCNEVYIFIYAFSWV